MGTANEFPTRAEFRAAAERALDFLSASFDDKGRHREMPEDPNVHFKLPYVFNYGGRRELALRVLEHIENDLINPDGSFRDPSQSGFTSMYVYSAGWLAWGSAALGRFDLARCFARCAMTYRDPQQGGFWNEFELGRVQWLLTSSSGVAGCAAAGELEAALQGTRYMAYLLGQQPDPDKGFYFNLGPDGLVVTAPAEDVTFSFYDYHDHMRPAMFATVIASLVWTGQQTADSAAFDLARRYADVMLSPRRDPAGSPFASKAGWAALLLHRHRPDADLWDFAKAVGRSFLERQTPDGSISLADWPGLGPQLPRARNESSTCDWVLSALALANGAA